MKREFLNAHNQDFQDVIRELKSNSETGLTDKEVLERRDIYGSNKLAEQKGASPLRVLLKQINNLLTYILILAVVLSTFSNHETDAIIISILIVINISLGFYHEYRAELRVESLKNFIKKECVVLRNNKKHLIPTEELVPGDIVLLEDGNSVPADLRIISSNELTVAEASLTGESTPVSKSNKTLAKETLLADRKNMLHLGSAVITGEAKAIVINTGLHTELGKISSQLKEIKNEKSLFYKRSENLIKQMFFVAIVTTVLASSVLFLRGASYGEIAQFSFATLISGIPEGLPSILTILLSIASSRMSKKQALLRNLPAIETLSTVTTIITDKTGTLTQNVMHIAQFLLVDKEDLIIDVSGEGWSATGEFFDTKSSKKILPNTSISLSRCLTFLTLISKGDAIEKADKAGTYELIGYPTEIARYTLAKKGGFKKEDLEVDFTILEDSPYNQESKLKSMLLTFNKKLEESGLYGEVFILVGGAENVLAQCKDSLSDKRYSQYNEYIEMSAKEGYRVQALAYKESGKDISLLAIFRINDPVRPDVYQSILAAHNAGIRVIMATGDHKATAVALFQPFQNTTLTANGAVSQDEIDKMSEEQFVQCVNKINIFARVTPSTKLRIAQVLQSQGEVIAMTGDGVNDSPVLKKADIGIAMGLIGTDVAKEASDMILLNDSFSTIIDAIEEGRTVFKNMRQTSLYLVTTNLAEALLIMISILLGAPLPLLPIQILWLNLVTDGLSDIALATEKAHHNILLEKPRKISDGIITKRDFLFIFTIAAIMASISIFVYLYYFKEDLNRARSLAFTLMVFTQLFNVINMRSLNQPIFTIGYFSNRAVNISIIISTILLLGALFTPYLQELFKFEQLTMLEIIGAFLLSSLVLVFSEMYKYLRGSVKV